MAVHLVPEKVQQTKVSHLASPKTGIERAQMMATVVKLRVLSWAHLKAFLSVLKGPQTWMAPNWHRTMAVESLSAKHLVSSMAAGMHWALLFPQWTVLQCLACPTALLSHWADWSFSWSVGL